MRPLRNRLKAELRTKSGTTNENPSHLGFRLATLVQGGYTFGSKLRYYPQRCFAVVAQLVEHVLGKDEVKGSSPFNSSESTRFVEAVDRPSAPRTGHPTRDFDFQMGY